MPTVTAPAAPFFLNVFLDAELVGRLYDTLPLSFEYADTWLQRLDRLSIATLPLLPERQHGPMVEAFFENLLPEGELRDHIGHQRQASSLFSLLRETAGDTAGAFILLPPNATNPTPSYVATTWESLATKLEQTSAAAIDLNGQDTRISLAGAQDKASIAIFSDNIPRLPRGIAPSTHILKPNIKRLNKIWESAANETIVMLTATRCGLPTAEVFYESTTRSCIVKRFDRVVHSDHRLTRLVQYDLCQLSGVLSEKKYEKEGGPGIEKCAALIREYSVQPAVDLRYLAQWVMFNLYVGNNDSHAKNLSMYYVPGKGLVLTPFYDLMCTRLYPGLANHFALSVGGETQPGKIGREHLTIMARQLGMQPGFLTKLGLDLAARIPAGLEQAINTVRPVLPHSAHVLSERLQQFVLSNTRKIAGRIAQ